MLCPRLDYRLFVEVSYHLTSIYIYVSIYLSISQCPFVSRLYRVIANLRTMFLGLRRDFAQVEPKSDLSLT